MASHINFLLFLLSYRFFSAPLFPVLLPELNPWVPRWDERTNFHMHAMTQTDRHTYTLIMITTIIAIFFSQDDM